MTDDKRAVIASVIRTTRDVRRARQGETQVEWRRAVDERLNDAKGVLGAYGEGKALGDVVALCTELLRWQDLSEVGVPPSSEPPWRVLLNDLVNIGEWQDGARRTRALKILHKLAYRLAHIEDEPVDGAVTVIEFCDERGLLADTLRYRLRRHNTRLGEEQIHPVGTAGHQRLLYKRQDLLRLLTQQEHARCR